MKNKKAILMPETLKIIIAVICIGLLLYLGVSLYGIFIKKTPIQQADASLDKITEKIEYMEQQEIFEAEVLLESPKDWWVIAWPYGDDEDKRKPKQCENYCICICPILKETYKDVIVPWSSDDTIEEALNECNLKGICNEVSKAVRVFDKENSGPVIIKPGVSLKIIYSENEIWITDQEYF